MQQPRAQGRHQYDRQAVHEQADQHRGQYEEPEPDEDVRLLIDDVERQDAERVVLLDRPGCTVLVEDALGDPREYVDHRVDPVFLRHVRELQHPQPIADELAAEESVHQVQLAEYVYKAEHLADEVPIHVRVVSLEAPFVAELTPIGLNEGELVLTRSSPSSSLSLSLPPQTLPFISFVP